MSNEIQNQAIELSTEELDVVAGGIGFGNLKVLEDGQSTDFSSLDIATRKKTASGRDGSEAISENRLSAVDTSADNNTFFGF
jgi:hypothetical protein